MIYREYGRTGIKVSAIGFGGMRFDDQNDIEACAELIQTSYDAGVNYFDTAPGYGKSEELFGVAFSEMNKTRAEKPFYVATKSNHGEPDRIRRDLEKSLKRMNLDCVDFFHMWCVLSIDGLNRRLLKGALKEFEKLKSEGLIKHICISSHMTGDDTGQVLRDYPFDGVLLGYSVMNFSYREQALETAAKLNRGVVVMNPLGGGLIPDNPSLFDFVRTRAEESVVEGALRFLINDPRITVALVGMGNQTHLREALSAVSGFQPIARERIKRIRDRLNQSFDEMCTGCQYCDLCPEGIPVPKLMDSYNLYMLSQESKKMLDRLYWHWGIAADAEQIYGCTECGNCEEACTQKLPIRDRIKDIQRQAKKSLRLKKLKKLGKKVGLG